MIRRRKSAAKKARKSSIKTKRGTKKSRGRGRR